LTTIIISTEQNAVFGVLGGMKEVLDVGFEVDLKILQALLPLTTNFPIVTADVLAEVIHTSKETKEEEKIMKFSPLFHLRSSCFA
jgi:hypothetical protein